MVAISKFCAKIYKAFLSFLPTCEASGSSWKGEISLVSKFSLGYCLKVCDDIILQYVLCFFTIFKAILTHQASDHRSCCLLNFRNYGSFFPFLTRNDFCRHIKKYFMYRKVASSRLSQLVAHSRIFTLFLKGKFDAYVL